MELNLLSQADYEELLYQLLIEVEGSKNKAYWDSNFILTIGIGFNIDAYVDDNKKYIDMPTHRKLIVINKLGLLDENKAKDYDGKPLKLLKNASFEKTINDISDKIFKILDNNRNPKASEGKKNLGRVIQDIEGAINQDSWFQSNIPFLRDDPAKNGKRIQLQMSDDEIRKIFTLISKVMQSELVGHLKGKKICATEFVSFLDKMKSSSVNTPATTVAKTYPQEFIPLLSNYYQQPAKFRNHDDSPEFLKQSLAKHKSRFLTWFGIRYYMERTAVADKKQRKDYYSRRVKEAAIFGIINLTTYRKDAEKAKYDACLDIFTHLNAFLEKIHTNNAGLAEYKESEETTTIFSLLLDKDSRDVDKMAVNLDYSLLGAKTRDYAVKKTYVDKNAPPDIILDNASSADILKPFVEYINKKFVSTMDDDPSTDSPFSADKIYVTSNPNKLRLKAAIRQAHKEHRDNEKTKNDPFKILIISTSKGNTQLRFDDILQNDKNAFITLALENGKEREPGAKSGNNTRVYYINTAKFKDSNFRILIYNIKDGKPEWVTFINGILDPKDETKTEGFITYESSMEDTNAWFNTSSSILTINYKKTFIYLTNYIPLDKQACFTLSNADKVKAKVNPNSQIGNTKINVTFTLPDKVTDEKNNNQEPKEKLTYADLNGKSYYMYINDTDEIIDTKITVNGTEAIAKFKYYEGRDKKSNSKLIFTFNKLCFSSKEKAHKAGEDFCHINNNIRKKGEVNTNFKINIYDTEYGHIFDVIISEISCPPGNSDYLDCSYTVNALHLSLENAENIKWSYGLFSQSEMEAGSTSYKDKDGTRKTGLTVIKKEKLEKHTGEEIIFTPSKLLTKAECNLLKAQKAPSKVDDKAEAVKTVGAGAPPAGETNNAAFAPTSVDNNEDAIKKAADEAAAEKNRKKLFIFAYIRSTAYKTKRGQTHCVIEAPETEEPSK